jgi:3-oxoacyl-[acyl-carrier protein] reductase
MGLGAAGAAVVVNYASRVVAEISGKAIAVQAEVSKADHVARFFAEAIKAFGSANVLVNNAGVYSFCPLESVTEEEFHRQFNSNVLGTFLTTQEAVKAFGDNGGSIINIASAAIETHSPGSSLYTAGKAAVVAATRVLSKELGPRKIRIKVENMLGLRRH